MWMLVTSLQLILKDVLYEGLPALQNYISMLEILCISFADEIDIPNLNYLTSIISEYLETFQTVYNESLIPKQHFLGHRPEHITKYGPLSYFSKFRLEAKHQSSKKNCSMQENL